MKKRVVITGLGPVTALGEGAENFWLGLTEGRSGIGRVSMGDGEGALSRTAARVHNFDPDVHSPRVFHGDYSDD